MKPNRMSLLFMILICIIRDDDDHDGDMQFAWTDLSRVFSCAVFDQADAIDRIIDSRKFVLNERKVEPWKPVRKVPVVKGSPMWRR